MPYLVRPYHHQDRSAVRRIACDTADRGEPVEQFFRDREVFADLVTGYYTEYEPESLWIAEHDGEVIGYLTGCLDSLRRERIMVWRIVPQVLGKAICRGVVFSRQTGRWIIAGLRTQAQKAGPQLSLKDYPAHLHVNIQQPFRGQQLGRRLLEQFLHQVHATGLKGVHATVRSDNPSSCRFFERAGFVLLNRQRVIFPYESSFLFHEKVIYGKRL